jgi:transcriptional regulator with XRE-family HTH domain
MNISKNLKRLRESQELSYRRLAEKVGISHNNLALYEKRKMKVSLESAIRICKYFNVPLEYLIAGEKADLKYHDMELVELFALVDSMEVDYRRMIKKYIKKVIKNSDEKHLLDDESLE